MRVISAFFAALTFGLSGCGGGGAGESQPGAVPTGSVSGIAFDGLITNGTVRVYDFSGGTQGALLAQTATNDAGLYSLTLQIESRPLLIEVTGGLYKEEASERNVALDAALGHRLTATINYTTGAAVRTAVTTYTHLAAGLAAYQLRNGTAVSSAIDNANSRLSGIVGANILTTTPRDITNTANISPTITPSIRYGFLAGAISLWTHSNSPSAPGNPVDFAHVPPYTSIDFAQTLYNDITTDGLLDGQGRDSAGNPTSLSFGAVALGPDTLRFDVGAYLVRMAAHENNRTGITGPAMRAAAESYISNTDPVFGGVAPRILSVTAGMTSPATETWMRRSITIVPAGTASTGIAETALLVDGTVVATVAGASPAPIVLNTALHTDGPREITVRITDNAGIQVSTQIIGRIDNTAPTITGYYAPDPQWLYGSGADNYSGFLGSQSIRNGTNPSYYTGIAANGTWSVTDGPLVYFGPARVLRLIGITVVRVTDRAGNCSDFNFAGTTTLRLLQANTCP